MLKKNKFAVFGLIVLTILVIGAVFAPIIAPYDPGDIIEDHIAGPSLHHIFGTDDLGRDIFSRILYGGRVSLSVAVIAVAVSMTIGVLLGCLSGFYGGLLDEVVMRFTDIMLSFPTIFLILAIQSVLTPSIFNVMLVIGATSWMGIARLVRGEFLTIREREYVEAAKAIGCGDLRIIFKHILPNALPPVIVAGTLGMAGAILTESALSFLGLGVQPPTASWGNMLMDSQSYLIDAPWMAIIPGIIIVLAVLSLYFVGEALRSAINPKENNG
jgi:peptide/nickel transport system permease protein